MNTPLAGPAPIFWSGSASALTAMRRRIATAAGLLLFSLGALLLARRLAGALQRPLAPGELLTAGLLLAAAVAVIHWLGAAPGGEASRRGKMDWLARWTPSAALLLLAVTLSSPRPAPRATLVLFWLLLAAEEAAWSILQRRSSPRGAIFGPRLAEPIAAPAPSLDAADTPALRLDQPETRRAAAGRRSSPHPPREVSQQWTRSRLENGEELLEGWMRGDFAPGQRSQSLHVAFCPPLDGPPRVKVEQRAGPSVSLKVGESRPYGARLDLRLPAARAEAVCVLVRLEARASRPHDSND